MVKTKLSFAGASDPGRVRTNNEDAFHMDGERGIFLVVDGIGGQAAGEKAAEIAVSRIRARLERGAPSGPGAAEQRIREAIAMANNAILEAARERPEWHGMACVLTLAVIDEGTAVIGHVGDSRLYQIRRGEIRKITHDHSPVGEREDSHEISEAEAMRHPRRNEIFRDVGSEEHAPGDADFIELQRIPFEPDGALVLCSDGLSDMVPSAEIRRAVERHAGDPEAAVRELIEAANRAGGKDNVTVLVIEGEDFTAPEEAANGRRGSKAWIWIPLLAVAAAAGGAGGVWWQRRNAPPPVVIAPRVLVAGPGAGMTTIGEAMAQARAGDTVEVLTGEYAEPVRLKSGVTLRSRVPRDAILRAPPLANGPIVEADGVSNARISGFTIRGDDKEPIPTAMLLNNSDIEVDDMEISGAGVGIEIRGGRPSLLGNAIHDCAQGILITGAAAPWLSHNSLQRNKASGLAARGEARPVLIGNVFQESALELPAEMALDTVKERNFFMSAPPRKRTVRKGK